MTTAPSSPRTRRKPLSPEKQALQQRQTDEILEHQVGVYVLRIGGKVYVGGTRSFDRRAAQHLKALRNGRHHARQMQRAWNAAGAPDDLQFEVIERCTLDTLGEREEYHIARLKATDPAYGYNTERTSRLKPGGHPERRCRGFAQPGVTPAAAPTGTLRDVQREALNAIQASVDSGETRGLVKLPCGTGKTVLAAHIAALYPNAKLLFVTHRNELVDQALASFQREWPGHDIGVIQREEFFTDARITVASRQTLERRLEVLERNTFDFVICDEAHLFGARRATLILAHFQTRYVLGLTATPHREQGTSLDTLFERIIYSATTERAVNDDILVPIRAVSFDPEINEDDLDVRFGQYTNASEAFDTSHMNRAVAQRIREYAAGKSVLAFACNLKHAGHLTNALRSAGLHADVVHAADPSRKRKIQAFRDGEMDVLVNVGIASYGFDMPELRAVAVVKPTRSPVLFEQMIGRVTRVSAGKTEGLVLDFGGNFSRGMLLDMPMNFSITDCPLTPPQEHQQRTPLSIDTSRDGQSAGQEVHLHDRPVLDPYGHLLRAGEGRASSAQHALLRSMGIGTALDLSSAEASALISRAPSRAWQVQRLLDAGVQACTSWSYMECKAALDALKRGQAVTLLSSDEETPAWTTPGTFVPQGQVSTAGSAT